MCVSPLCIVDVLILAFGFCCVENEQRSRGDNLWDLISLYFCFSSCFI